MNLADLLDKKNWKGSLLKKEIVDSEIKYLDDKVTGIHNLIESVNKTLSKGGFLLTTNIVGWKKTNHYILKIKIRYYGTKKEYKHKKNSHRQKINI